MSISSTAVLEFPVLQLEQMHTCQEESIFEYQKVVL